MLADSEVDVPTSVVPVVARLLKVTHTFDNMNNPLTKHTRDEIHPDDLAGDFFRGNEYRYDKWGQATHQANEFVTRELNETDPHNQKAKEEIWDEKARKHIYNVNGLKISDMIQH